MRERDRERERKRKREREKERKREREKEKEKEREKFDEMPIESTIILEHHSDQGIRYIGSICTGNVKNV